MSALGTFLKGMAMGAADVVPGVSGGTVALITGIYQTLIDSIRAFDLSLARLLLRGEFRAGWHKINGGFLLALVAGIALSLLSLARAISVALERYPVAIYSFFIGLIIASACLLLRDIARWRAGPILSLLVGALLMLLFSELRPLNVTPTPLMLFGAGAIAICAMILPGISGSFLLLMMGLYPFILEAVHRLQWLPLAIFAAGCACGLLSFVRLLSWLLHRHHDLLMAFLIGVLFASVKILWPWTAASGDLALPESPGMAPMAFLLGVILVAGVHIAARRSALARVGD